MDISQIRQLLGAWGVENVGVCRLADCLPLLPCGAARRVPVEARSVIICLFPWNIGDMGERRNVARYAVLPDYHTVVGGILRKAAATMRAECPDEDFACFVDSSPLREVSAAARAGLGVVGKHGLLIHPVYGADVFIGEIVTTLELAPTESGRVPGGCRNCGRCIAACPTGALMVDAPLDRVRCRSHITQKKGELTPWETGQILAGGLAWGCDICTGVCPIGTAHSPIAAFYDHPVHRLTRRNLDSLLAEKPYGYRGRAVLERNLDILGDR